MTCRSKTADLAVLDFVNVSMMVGIDSRISRIVLHILIPTFRLNLVILAEGCRVEVEGSVSRASIASVSKARELMRSVNVVLVLKVLRDRFNS